MSLFRGCSKLLDARDPTIQIIPTWGPKVCKYYLHWAIWITRVTQSLNIIVRKTLKAEAAGVAQLPLSGVYVAGV